MDTQYVGQIQPFGFNFAPRGWALCNGQLMSISQNTALFSLLGTNYGGDGVQTFALPNMQGRVAIGQGQSPGTSQYQIGQFGGLENITLAQNQMPSHTHVATFASGGGGSPAIITSSMKASTMQGTTNVPTASVNTLAAPVVDTGGRALTPVSAYVADPNPSVILTGLTVTLSGGSIGSGTVTNAPTGGNTPVPILQPYLAINYCIALLGIFPSRN